MKIVLIASVYTNDAEIIAQCLDETWIVEYEINEKDVQSHFSRKKYDYIFLDVVYLQKSMIKNDPKSALKPFWHIFPDTEIIVLTPQQKIRDAVEYVKVGACDYLTTPVLKEDIHYIIDRAEQKAKLLSELQYLRNAYWKENSDYVFKINSDKMKKILNDVRSVAPMDSTVLITGETGTGKGMIARLIHQYSKRSDQQFIAIHCGAIPDSLLESELFGHEKGAFTGAIRRKPGKFEIAHGGTIFLDEIGTISSNMQVKLLKVLQDKSFYRVGGEVEIKSDVRIIAATNSNLVELSDKGSFRTDLFYRLNVFQIEMPPLRERKSDIPLLTSHIMDRLNRNNAKNIHGIHPEVLQAFEEYSWPGNIRELENLLERAYILEQSDTLTANSFPLKLFRDKLKKYIPPVDISRSLAQVRNDEISRIEKEYLTGLLQKNKGKINISAIDAGITTRQLHKLLTKYKINKNTFK
jgi:DNA-binding NtrC family response regulator